MADFPLGRKTPNDFAHVEKFPLRTVAAVAPTLVVERTLALPYWHWTHDQGNEGSCVGHGVAMERAITNGAQNKLAHVLRATRRYDPIDIWNEAKKVDDWPDTNPGDENGTSVRAGYDVMRDRGPRRVRSMRFGGQYGVPTPVGEGDPLVAEGAVVNRWATTVDEMRQAISDGAPVTIGVTWYSGFDPQGLEQRGRDWWITSAATNTSVRGGHCVCLYGASDRRQAFKLKNSWGRGYPLVWLPYSVMEILLADDGEAAVVTDR